MKSAVKHLIPPFIKELVLSFFFRKKAKEKGLQIHGGLGYIDIVKKDDIVRISTNHSVYLEDIINSFEYYFCAVIPFKYQEMNMVDYSTPRYHDVVGFEFIPIMFPSFAEPIITTNQYLEFANLNEGMVVLDLGSYSGLTSIIFSQAVGKTGIVVAVDADPNNIECIKRNINNYKKHSCNKVIFLEGAVWNHDNGIEFSCEGNMGASAASIVGKNRGMIKKIQSFTLNSICNHFSIERVDFIKCDVEGAEMVIFKDDEFFSRFSPRIIIETHLVDLTETTEKCMSDLGKYGYTFKRIIQKGVHLPLIECYPSN